MIHFTAFLPTLPLVSCLTEAGPPLPTPLIKDSLPCEYQKRTELFA